MAKYRKLGRKTDHRIAMLKNLTMQTLEYGKIETTETRAKEVRRLVDKMIKLAKRGDLHARRQALAFIPKKEVVMQLFKVADEKYGNRNSGYTRIYKLHPRRGDAAYMAILEIIEGGIYSDEKPEEKSKDNKKELLGSEESDKEKTKA